MIRKLIESKHQKNAISNSTCSSSKPRPDLTNLVQVRCWRSALPLLLLVTTAVHSGGGRPGCINGHRSGHSTPVTHCLHLSSARSDRKLRHLSSSCSDLSPQLVSSLPLAARVSLTPRTPRYSRSRGSTPGTAVTAPPSPSRTAPCLGRRALLTGRGKAQENYFSK